MICSTIVPSNNMRTSWSMSACSKAPGMLVTATCLPSLASIAYYSIMASRDTVGELASAFVIQSLCAHLMAQPLALMLPSHFSFRNIIYHNGFFFSSCYMSSLFMGSSASCWWNWFSSLSSASFPFSPNLFKPSHTFIWVMMTCACGFGIATIADCWLSCNRVYLLFLSVGLGLRWTCCC